MASQAESIAESRKVARSSGLELVLPECEKGIGAVILRIDSPHLIEGVRIQQVALWPDDRGYFLEVQRLGQGLAAAFPADST
jgi:dTDP-4-dehydrorhamnose 3,5-epimerase